jgi:nicotinate-nucleotide--dimethylbenzimidazole phosphoribosyltransferase
MKSHLEREVQDRLDFLTKPPGSLGKLEELARRYALIRGSAMPALHRKALFVFCADHGVAAEGVSAYPAEITRAMVRNFIRGGAAVSVLCRHWNIDPVIIDMGVCGAPEPGAVDRKIAHGTRNFAQEAAMTRDQAERCVQTGRELALNAAAQYDVLAAGEMGIANTTAAAALLSAFSGHPAERTAGRGTGVDPSGLERKIDTIQRALELHRLDPADPMAVLAAIGGFEIGAIAGFILGAAEARVPIVLDGFISCSAALIARAIQPSCMECVLFSHISSERGHALMLDHLEAEPYVALDMRLGEGTGAAIAITLLEASVKLYREMATFADL